MGGEIVFTVATVMVGFVCVVWILSDIKIELKYNNTLLEKQNELLKKKL